MLGRNTTSGFNGNDDILLENAKTYYEENIENKSNVLKDTQNNYNENIDKKEVQVEQNVEAH
jgi:hypothetical protein